MKHYALVYFIPETNAMKIKKLKEEYDPYAKLIDPHVTFLFPVPETIGLKGIIAHVQRVLSTHYPFKVHFKGFHKSWDNWLLMDLKKGNDEVIKIHDDLYTDILKSQLRTDIEFTPHVGIGLFKKKDANYDLKNPTTNELDEEAYNKALKEIKKEKIDDFECEVDRLSLVEVDFEKYTKASAIKEFRL